MKVTELSREQLIELKQSYLCDNGYEPSWYELATADNLVSDETVFEEYEDVHFVNDDFFCTANK